MFGLEVFGFSICASKLGSSTAVSLPTFAIVPGAWHSPEHWNLVISELNAAGYATRSLRLPGVDSSTPQSISTTTDADFIHSDVLVSLLRDGKDIILIANSYGGMPSGIIGLTWVAALVAHPGDSLKALMGGQFGSWMVIDQATGQLGYEDPQEIFYNDVPRPVAKGAISQPKPQSENALSTPTGPQAWGDAFYNGRRAYVTTLLDQCIPPIAQSGMVAGSAVTWDVIQYDTGHSSFLAQPLQLSRTLIELAKKWQ